MRIAKNGKNELTLMLLIRYLARWIASGKCYHGNNLIQKAPDVRGVCLKSLNVF